MHSPGPHSVPFRPVPGLLPWQSCFLAFVLGIFAFRDAPASLAALAVLVMADASLRGWARRLPVLAFVLCAAAGFGYASWAAPDAVAIPAWVEARQPAEVRAVVERAEPRMGGGLRVLLRDVVCRVGDDEYALDGQLVWNWRHPDFRPLPGQALAMRMKVVPVRNFGNPGGWDFEWYWQRQGVQWRGWPADRQAAPAWGEPPDSLLHTLKSRLRRAVADKVPDTQGGAMVLALVTGDRSGLSLATVDATRRAGLAHTLALSGLHVGFVAAMGLALAWIIGRLYPSLFLLVPRPKLAVLLAAPLVLGYAWLGQPSASLIRAAVMFGFWGFLLLRGRGRVLLDGLFFALAVIVFLSPFSVFDLSLQMSAVAVAGIAVLYPPLHARLSAVSVRGRRILLWAGGLLGISLCANLALLPLISRNFGSFTPDILFNLIWIPALGLAVMPLGVMGMLLSAFSWTAPLDGLLLTGGATLMDWLLTLLRLAEGGGMLPVFSVLRPLWPEMLGGVVLLLAAFLAVANRRALPLLAGLGFALLVWPQVAVMLDDARDEVRLSLIDVGTGQAALLRTPGGHRWLIDGGAGSTYFDMGEFVVAPYLTYGRPPRLDGVFMSHPDADHSHGLPFVLSRFRVDRFYTNGMLPRGRTGKRMRAVLKARDLAPVPLHAGEELELSPDVSFHVLHPAASFKSSRANERSLVLRLVRRGRGLALLPGDVEQEGLGAVLQAGTDLRAEVLVLPHHGSRSSLSPALYRAVSPEVALCSDGYLNRYGFPHERVVHAVGVPVVLTSRHGLLTAAWDGQGEMAVKAFLP